MPEDELDLYPPFNRQHLQSLEDWEVLPQVTRGAYRQYLRTGSYPQEKAPAPLDFSARWENYWARMQGLYQAFTKTDRLYKIHLPHGHPFEDRHKRHVKEQGLTRLSRYSSRKDD